MFYKTVFGHLGEPELFDCISSDYIGSPLPLCLLKYSSETILNEAGLLHYVLVHVVDNLLQECT